MATGDVVAVLRENKNRFMDTQELSDALDVSRTTVCENLRRARKHYKASIEVKQTKHGGKLHRWRG